MSDKKHKKSDTEEVQMKRKNKRKAIIISDDEDDQMENSIEEFSPIKEPQVVGIVHFCFYLN